MNLLLLSDNYPPETNALASRSFEHARIWTDLGHSVTVITCAPNYPERRVHAGYQNRLYSVNTHYGIRVIRVWSRIPGRSGGLLTRFFAYVSYADSAFFAGFFAPADIIVGSSLQLFVPAASWLLSIFRRKPWVFEVRDLWPASIRSLGMIREGFVCSFLERLELLLYRQADLIVVVTHSFRKNLVHRGIRDRKIHEIPNGVTLDQFRWKSRDDSLVRRIGMRNSSRTVFGYLGTVGIAQCLSLVVSVVMKRPDCSLLIVWDGTERNRIHRMVDSKTDSNVVMHDPVPKDQVPRYFSILGYVLVVLQDKPIFRSEIPSKIFEAAAMECSIILGVAGEARKIVEQYGGGIAFEPGDEESLLSTLDRATDLLRSQEYRNIQEGCRQLAVDFSRKELASDMIGKMKELL